MFAIVEAEMSTRLSAPRCNRSADSGALVSENGVEAISLMSTPLIGGQNVTHRDDRHKDLSFTTWMLTGLSQDTMSLR